MSQSEADDVFGRYNVLSILNTLDTSADIPGAIRKTKGIVEKSGCEFYQGGSPILDARVLHAASGVVVACATNATNAINAYDSYLVASHMRSNPDYWEYLYPREVPVISYLQGTFNPIPVQKPTVLRSRVEKQQARPVRNPDKLARVEHPSGESTEAVEKMYEFLKAKYKRTPCSYFHLVLDPTSFTRTVENIYNFAFLVKNCLVAIFIDEDSGLPYFKINEADERKRNTPEDQKEHFIDSIDMRHWKSLGCEGGRSEMQDYDKSGRELDRSNSKESYKDFDYKDRRNDSDRKPLDMAMEHSRTAADKLTEVFERKSVGLVEPFASTEMVEALHITQPMIAV